MFFGGSFPDWSPSIIIFDIIIKIVVISTVFFILNIEPRLFDRNRLSLTFFEQCFELDWHKI